MSHRERLLEALKLDWPKDGDVETAGAGRIQEVNVALGFPRMSAKQLSVTFDTLHVLTFVPNALTEEKLPQFLKLIHKESAHLRD